MPYANENTSQVSSPPQSLGLGGKLQNRHREQTTMSAISQSCVYFHIGREDSTDTCSICLTAFAEGEYLARHTACNNRFHAICLLEWRVTQNIQRQRARCPLCRGHLCTFTTPATRPPLSDLLEGLEVEIARLRLIMEVASSPRRTTASGMAVRDLRSSPARSGTFRQL